MSNVFSLTTRKPITSVVKTRARRKAAPATTRTFSRTDDLAPHLLEPGYERNGAVHIALVLALDGVNPPSFIQRDPHEALRKTRRALAILEIECAELDRATLKGGAQ